MKKWKNNMYFRLHFCHYGWIPVSASVASITLISAPFRSISGKMNLAFSCRQGDTRSSLHLHPGYFKNLNEQTVRWWVLSTQEFPPAYIHSPVSTAGLTFHKDATPPQKNVGIFVGNVAVSQPLSGFLGDLSTGDSQSKAGPVTDQD